MIGHNTSREALRGFVERLEALKSEKRLITEDEKLVKAEAAASGFLPKAINHILRLRAMKPTDRQESEAVIDSYLFAMGMVSETALSRQVGLINVDIASRDSVIEALKAFVPENGSIVVDAGGKPVRLTRAKDGEVSVEEVVDRPPAERPAPPSPGVARRAPPPDVDDGGAEALGAEAFKANQAVISNPFPFGDVRRARWDEGWRKASGTDGMGPGGGEG